MFTRIRNTRLKLIKTPSTISSDVPKTISTFNFSSNKEVNKIEVLDRSQLQYTDIIDRNFGLKQFIKQTYMWTGLGITSSLGLSLTGSYFPQIIGWTSPGIFLGGCALLSIGGAIGVGMGKYTIHRQLVNINNTNGIALQTQKKDISFPNETGFTKSNQIEIIYSTNSPLRTLSYTAMLTGNGLMFIPIFIALPNAVIPAFIASGSVFGGATLYAWKRKPGELDHWGPVLYGGLSGLVVVSLLGVGSQMFLGQNWFGDMTHMISLYGGIPLFTGLIALDTKKAIEKYQDGEPDHLGCSTELYLDFMNLFIRFIEIISKIQKASKSDDDK
jgi:FtsH-binding integral membrane protein